MNSEDEIIEKYNQFLKQSLKTFDILFLRYSKEEYVEIMQKKGKEMEEKEDKMKKELKCKKKENKWRRSVVTKKQFVKRDEEEDDDNEDVDKEIFNKFMKEIKNKKGDFVNKKK